MYICCFPLLILANKKLRGKSWGLMKCGGLFGVAHVIKRPPGEVMSARNSGPDNAPPPLGPIHLPTIQSVPLKLYNLSPWDFTICPPETLQSVPLRLYNLSPWDFFNLSPWDFTICPPETLQSVHLKLYNLQSCNHQFQRYRVTRKCSALLS